MNDEVILTYEEESTIELEYVEAAIKPEVTGHVTPTYEEQTVYPAAGTTFGRVEVDAIPDPTAIKEIGSNGDHDVRRYGVARVDVQPTLQNKTATPTEQAQTVLPDTGYDGLESVNIARIPTEYIIPTGTKNISQNGTESVREYDSVDVQVVPTLQDKTIVPTKQTQTMTADSGYDGLDSVQVDPIPSEYIIPQGKVTITQNGTVNVSQYAEAEVSVSSTPQPILLDTIDISDFSEPVNRITIDCTQYDLTGKIMLYVVCDNVKLSTNDWLYFKDTTSAAKYFGAQKNRTFNCVKVFFAKIEDIWGGVMGNGGNTYPQGGDRTPISSAIYYPYTSSTTFESGRLKVYAV